MSRAAIARARRVIDAARAGASLAPEDAIALAAAVARAFDDNVTLEEALGLRGQWRAAIRHDVRIELCAEVELAPGEHLVDAARRLQRKMIVDHKSGRPNDLLAANGGTVPSVRILRKWLSKQ